MEGYHHHHHHLSVSMDTGDRVPQWSLQETKELLTIRSELDQTFMETKRNKILWGIISTKMKEKGYLRSADQCKCKWKNLVTRFKGCEMMEPDIIRQQFPFYNELQAIFSARMQRMVWLEAESGASNILKKKGVRLSSDDEEENEGSDEEKGSKKKRKGNKSTNTSGNTNNNLQEILEDFTRQQIQLEVQWRKAAEAREEERRMKEVEWRQKLEALEKERLLMDKSWREREEKRWMREEARAEKRDALITTLLNKLRYEEM